jgi:hypothetical protein
VNPAKDRTFGGVFHDWLVNLFCEFKIQRARAVGGSQNENGSKDENGWHNISHNVMVAGGFVKHPAIY